MHCILLEIATLLVLQAFLRIPNPYFIKADEGNATTVSSNNTQIKNETTEVTIDSSWDKCYICKYTSTEPHLPPLNDKNCLLENPNTKLPCSYNTCGVWTFSVQIRSQKFEATAKVCVSPALLTCYEQITGGKLVYGQCTSVGKLSKKQLEILISKECGNFSLPKITSKSKSNEEDEMDLETQDNVNGRSLSDILKFKSNYEVCVCKGNLCNTYQKKPEENKPKKSLAGGKLSKTNGFRSIIYFIAIFILFTIF